MILLRIILIYVSKCLIYLIFYQRDSFLLERINKKGFCVKKLAIYRNLLDNFGSCRNVELHARGKTSR